MKTRGRFAAREHNVLVGEILKLLKNAGHSKEVAYKPSFKDIDTSMSSAKQPSTKAAAANKIQAQSADFYIYSRRSQEK